MKIALIAPVEETVPPQKYGGTEWIIYAIAHGMGKKSHEIDLYASSDSKKEDGYNLIPIVAQSLRSNKEFAENLKLRESAKLLAIADTLELLKTKKYDIVHNHASWRFLAFANLIPGTPVITTHHGPLSLAYQNIVFVKRKNLPHISISDNQRKDLPELNFAATIYNGIDIDHYPISNNINIDQSTMLFLARMSPEKGAVEAAKVALQLKKKLVVAAKVDEVDKPYFASFQPLIDNDLVTSVGEIDFEKKLNYLQTAKLLLAPIRWEEPFGLMFTEAMACGTPVVAFSRGAAPEIIADGKTGFLVNESEEYVRGNWIVKKTGIEGLCEAVERIYSMPKEEYLQMRKNCRDHVEKNFTVEKMVSEYERVYERVLSGTVKQF